jgi:hypothetical protein
MQDIRHLDQPWGRRRLEGGRDGGLFTIEIAEEDRPRRARARRRRSAAQRSAAHGPDLHRPDLCFLRTSESARRRGRRRRTKTTRV